MRAVSFKVSPLNNRLDPRGDVFLRMRDNIDKETEFEEDEDVDYQLLRVKHDRMGVVGKDGLLKGEFLNHCHISKVVAEVYGDKVVAAIPEPAMNGQFEKTVRDFCMLLRICSFTKAFQEPDADNKGDTEQEAPEMPTELESLRSALEMAHSGKKAERDEAWKAFDPNGTGQLLFSDLSTAMKSHLKSYPSCDEVCAR